ncbi:MAG TPA: lysylphosphatidylglycerol synthase transmembrane domain-containing protein [Spirochaetia bacterium]|nr:lysylphosphatidylglycerol synthase transmembrane domain-containing protein [Spirochaetia bacterium]
MKAGRVAGLLISGGAVAALGWIFLRDFDFHGLEVYVSRRGILIVLAVASFQLLIGSLSTAQWSLLLRGAGIRVSPIRLFFARLGGSSVTYISLPVAVGGEVVRASLVKDRDNGYGALSATIAADKAVEIGTRIPAVSVGLIVLAVAAGQGTLLRPLSWALAAVVAAGLALAVVLTMRRRSRTDETTRPTGRFFAAFAKVAPKTHSRLAHGVAEFRDCLRAVLTKRELLAGAFALGVAASLVDVLQLYLLMRATAPGLSGGAFVMYASAAVQGSFAFLPGNAGGMEATSAFVFKLLGADPGSGVAYALLLRCGQLLWVAVGLAYVAYRAARGRVARREAAALLAAGEAGGPDRPLFFVDDDERSAREPSFGTAGRAAARASACIRTRAPL